MVPSPLPLSDLVFAVADALNVGTSRKRLRGLDLNSTVWGIRLASTETATLLQRCRMFAERMPANAFFSHATAALLLGAPLPPKLKDRDRLHISIPAPGRAPHAAGVRGHELEVRLDEIVLIDGLRSTSAVRTWCDLATILHLPDLVAVGDYLIHWRLPLCTQTELALEVARLAGRRGVQRLREALPLLDDRAESHPESVLRVILILGGLPTPTINRDVVDTEGGFVGRTDLEFEQFGLILEYQGDYHRSKPGQWRKDMTRRSRLEATGRQVMDINADDLKDADELVARIRMVLIARGWRA